MAEIKNELGQFYNALAKDLIRSSQMESNDNPEQTLQEGRYTRQRALDVLTEATEHKPGDIDIKVKLAQVLLFFNPRKNPRI